MNKTLLLFLAYGLLLSCAGLQKAPDRPSSRQNSSRISFGTSDDHSHEESKKKNTPAPDQYASVDNEIPPSTSVTTKTVVSAPKKEKVTRSASNPTKAPKNTLSYSRQSTIDQARSYLGIPYQYGGCDREGLDCSGLIQQIFASQGHLLPRNSRDQSKYGTKIKKSQVQPGDLVFFAHKGRVHHLGLVTQVAKNQLWVIHSTSSKGVIEQEVLSNSYWNKRLHSYRRVL